MFKLKTGYFITGIITGLILVFNFFRALPDGKLHIVFCDVGQGDAAYITFPGGRDMIIDTGPGGPASSTGGKTPKVLGCLSRHMSIFDRTIDVVVLSHPEEDHMGGVEEILKRYTVGTIVRSATSNTTEGFKNMQTLIQEKHIPERIVATGENITIGKSTVSVLWPRPATSLMSVNTISPVLGATTNLNDTSIVLAISYGNFDVLFPGDADSHIDGELIKRPIIDEDGVEVVKVPHHGSKTGMTDGFLQWLGPVKLAVISVGKNSYGHPAAETISKLSSVAKEIMRTDQKGDIELISDGKIWSVKTAK